MGEQPPLFVADIAHIAALDVIMRREAIAAESIDWRRLAHLVVLVVAPVGKGDSDPLPPRVSGIGKGQSLFRRRDRHGRGLWRAGGFVFARTLASATASYQHKRQPRTNRLLPHPLTPPPAPSSSHNRACPCPAPAARRPL